MRLSSISIKFWAGAASTPTSVFTHLNEHSNRFQSTSNFSFLFSLSYIPSDGCCASLLRAAVGCKICLDSRQLFGGRATFRIAGPPGGGGDDIFASPGPHPGYVDAGGRRPGVGMGVPPPLVAAPRGGRT